MPMQQVEYEFPDPDKDEKLQEVEIKEISHNSMPQDNGCDLIVHVP